MTSLSSQKPAPLGTFLNSVSPGIHSLDSNIHFKISPQEDLSSSTIDWPLNSTKLQRASLNDTYLNISRPSLGAEESTTYVSLPYHILKSFKNSISAANRNSNAEGQLQIAANLNPLVNDPFKLVHLNPGCLSVIVETPALGSPLVPVVSAPGTHNSASINSTNNTHTHAHAHAHGHKLANLRNPFNKLSNNFNKLLKLSSTSTLTSYHQSLLSLENHGIVESVLEYDSELYKGQLKDAKKLLVSAHINVLNVIAIDEENRFLHSKTTKSQKPIVYVDEELLQQQQAAQQQAAPSTSSNPPQTPTKGTNSAATSASPSSHSVSPEYTRTTEDPILRIQFRKPSIITVLKSFNNVFNQPIIVAGFNSGEIIVLNLKDLSYHTIDFINCHTDTNFAVTSIEVISGSVSHADMLIVAGYSNGEVLIVDPQQKDPVNSKYVKRVISQDEHVTYFKKFDLSPFHSQEQSHNQPVSSSASTSSSSTISSSTLPASLIGHFKLSHKPITSITSTITYGANYAQEITSSSMTGGTPAASTATTNTNNATTSASASYPNPMVLAFGSDDGFVRLIDLMATYDCNYGTSLPTSNTILTDIISNYFNDGISCIKFSPDLKFLCLAGKGDIIEVFKMTYYNVNGLLNHSKHHSTTTTAAATTTSVQGTGRRSRSNTLNSLNSNPQVANTSSPANAIEKSSSANTSTPSQVFLSPLASTPSVSFEMNNIDQALLTDGSSTNIGSASAIAPATSSASAHSASHYPPVIKDVSIVARFKGHANTVHKVDFLRDSSVASSTSAYKLISCGFDGKVIVWDFDYKALPKVKEHHHHPQHHHQAPSTSNPVNGSTAVSRKRSSFAHRSSFGRASSPSPLPRGKPLPPTPGAGNGQPTTILAQASLPLQQSPSASGIGLSKHARTLSWSIFDDSNGTIEKDDNKVLESIKIINSVYKNLFDLRLKKHRLKLGLKSSQKHCTVIHPIVKDKLVPSIEIPLLELDLSHWIRDGKIDGFHLDYKGFWCFAKSGDIFLYSIF